MLQGACNRLEDQKLLSLWEVVEKAQKDIAGNGNLRLTLEVMALQMSRLINASRA